MARTVTNTRVVDNDTGNTIAWIENDTANSCVLTHPNGKVIGNVFPDDAPTILLFLQIAGI